MTRNRRKKISRSVVKKNAPSTKPDTSLLEQLDTKVSNEVPESTRNKSTTGSWFSKKLYAVYGFFWIYLAIKVFVIDVEAWLFDLVGLEKYQLFLVLRIFLIPCILAAVISWKGYKVVLRHIFHFLTAPFYFTIYLFFKSVYDNLVECSNKRQNASFVVFFLEILGRFLARINYYLFSILGVATLLVCLFYPGDVPIQYGAFIVSLLLVGTIMYQSILKSVQPVKIFGFFKIDDIISFGTKKRPLLSLSKDSKPKTRAETVRELLFAYILSTVLQKNVTEVRERKSFLIVAFADFFLLILTITTYFTFLNYSLYLIAPHNFGGQENPHFWDFAYYSFYAIPGEGSPIEPVSQISRLIKVVTTFYGYYLFIFLGTMLVGVFSDKFAQALESASDYLQHQSKISEPKLSSMLGIPIPELKGLSLTKLFNLVNLIKDEKPKVT